MTPKLDFKQTMTAGVQAAGFAAIINACLFSLFHRAGVFIDTIWVQPNTPLSEVIVVISSIIPILIASVGFYLIEKYTKAGFKIFSLFAGIITLTSFSFPFISISNMTLGYAFILDLMHVVVFVSMLYFIKKQYQVNIS